MTGPPPIRSDHPRLFIDADRLPTVRERALGAESDRFERFRAECDERLGNEPTVADHGHDAAIAAFVGLVTDDDRYRELARNRLTASLDHYRACRERGEAVGWYAFSRVSAIAAYDWLHPWLGRTARHDLGQRILDRVDAVQPSERRESFRWENWGGPDGGLYGTPKFPWYAGVALAGDGIDDPRAERFLEDGYETHRELLDFRAEHAGDDGGGASSTLAYLLQAYPWAVFDFFHSHRSATGTSIAGEYDYPVLLPGYLYWNWLPGRRHFGVGDANHVRNELRLDAMHLHCCQLVHFYADSHPREAAFAAWLRERLPRETHYSELICGLPFARFLLTDMDDVAPEGPPHDADLPIARHFEGMGQTFFRSGSGPRDVYAQFTSAGGETNHKHWDANHFCIYRDGFLALDTGSRVLPGLHRSHYYATTLAHNCVLVRMPGEEFPAHWGRTEPAADEADHPVPNTGGQRHKGGETVAFESHDRFGYIAGDATETYHEDKCERILRQFVFVPPEHFVVFDRVVARDPDFEKRWVIHTAEEPTLNGGTMVADHGRSRTEGGRLFCRTVAPGNAEQTLVGGDGAQFVADGRNYPVPDPDEVYAPDETVLDRWPLLGQWRLEVRPEAAGRVHSFLHLLRASDQSVESMGRSEPIEGTDVQGVTFTADGADWEVTFGLDGEPTGHIRAVEDGTSILDTDLATAVNSQSGLFG